jgi:hypothetical protein
MKQQKSGRKNCFVFFFPRPAAAGGKKRCSKQMNDYNKMKFTTETLTDFAPA